MSPDEAFALITEPERLRRWQTVSARRRPARRWRVPLDDHPGTCRRGHVPRGRAGPADHLRLGMGGQRRPEARRVHRHGHGHGRTRGRRIARHPRARGADRGAGRDARGGLEPLLRAAAEGGHHRRRQPGRVGLRPREPDADHRRGGRPRRPPAGPAQPDPRGPPEAHAVHRVHLHTPDARPSPPDPPPTRRQRTPPD